MPELAVTAMGPDRPGIVAAVARVLHERGGNIEDSAMTILGGNFSMVLLVSTGQDQDAEVFGAGRAGGAATHLLSVYGRDHPGILAGVATALADVVANVTDLSSRLIGATDEPVSALVVEPSTDDEATVRAAVERVADQLGVDWTLRTLDDVTY